MVRKLFVRLFICFFALIGVALLSVCIAGYLAFQTPAFYADLRAQQFSKSDQTAANSSFQLTVKDLREWTDRSIASQRAPLPNSASLAAIFSRHYDPTQDTHSVIITETQLNTQLASAMAGVNRQMQNPRVRIGPDCIDFAFELVLPKTSCVLSTQLKPTITSDGRLRFDILAARIGRLPLPLRVLRWLPREISYSKSGAQWNLTAPTPYFCLDLPPDASKSPSVKSIKCAENEITIEFSAPILNRREDDRRATLPTASLRD